MSVDQYLSRYSESEVELAAKIDRTYDAALVLPVLGETAHCLDGSRAAVRELAGRALVVLVVNASLGTAPGLVTENAALLAELASKPVRWSEPGASLVTDPDFDVLVVDRSSAGRELPPRRGVGLARKIGSDLVLSLSRREKLALPWIFWADADARLPSSYFADARRAIAEPGHAGATALLFPFRHVAGDDAAVTSATLVHEMALRYHVLGLASAGSPYAHHSLGSAMAVEANAYALVRGAPKREAGEDFYLLDKLSKVGKIVRAEGEAVSIVARRSPRVPFGTGPKVLTILERGHALVANPSAFRVLRVLLGAIDAVSRERRLDPLDAASGGLPEPLAFALRSAIEASGLRHGAETALRTSGADLRRRLHTWFDALRTLRALHALRDAGLPDVPCLEALARTGFAGDVPLEAEPERILAALRAAEAELSRVLGPALLV